MAEKLYTLTSIAPGPRGLGMSDGTVLLLQPGQTSEPVKLTDDEAADAEATGWFKVEPVEPAKPAAKPAKADAAA